MSLTDGEIALRPRTEHDVAAITEACQDLEIVRWTPVPSPYTEDDAREFIRAAPDASAIVDARTGEFLGTIGWRWVDQNVQFGYWVKRDARGRGIAIRALRLLSPLGRPRARRRPGAARHRAGERGLPAGGREGGLHAGGDASLLHRAEGPAARCRHVLPTPRRSLSLVSQS